MNINEIAGLAGVSRATVSRYLNDGYVSDEKREKIKKVIEETGYQPSASAKMLRTQKTRMIGVILPQINSSAVGKMVAGIGDALTPKGYKLLLANTDNNEQEELKYLEFFRHNQVDGVILIATVLTEKHRELIRSCQVPIVVLGQQTEECSCVYQDDYHAAREMALRVLKTGTHIAYLGVNIRDRAVGYARKNGFTDALGICGIDQEKICWKEGGFSMESGKRMAEEILAEHPDIDTIYSTTDIQAVGAALYLREKGIPVPQQIQVCGSGNSTLGTVLDPQLATILLPYRASGREAASLLMEMLDCCEKFKNQRWKKKVCMGYEILDRGSLRRDPSF